MITAKLKGVSKILKHIDAERKRNKKALDISVKRQAFISRGTLQKEIRQGGAGSDKFKRLTFIARRRRGSKRWRPDKPLSRIATAIRYHVKNKSPLVVALGWTGSSVSESWKRIVKKQQTGFTQSISERQESFFRHRGGEIPRRSAMRPAFFLKKSTSRFKTPARPIIDPFLRKHRSDMLKNISRNYRLKMKGHRI